ncbi:MAG: hypothetical protein Q4G36_05615 [Paracoccus sp. (in: a-proteobacteria)]|nr:hypothetical protein [Paracoccus sp. (in: a-proteobacteria)]
MRRTKTTVKTSQDGAGLVLLASGFLLSEMNLVASAMRAAGFSVFLTDDEMLHILPNHALALGGIRLFVPNSEADRAALPQPRSPRRSWFYWAVLAFGLVWSGVGAAPVPVVSGIFRIADPA